jgi:hypothetical protein
LPSAYRKISLTKVIAAKTDKYGDVIATGHDGTSEDVYAGGDIVGRGTVIAMGMAKASQAINTA